MWRTLSRPSCSSRFKRHPRYGFCPGGRVNGGGDPGPVHRPSPPPGLLVACLYPIILGLLLSSSRCRPKWRSDTAIRAQRVVRAGRPHTFCGLLSCRANASGLLLRGFSGDRRSRFVARACCLRTFRNSQPCKWYLSVVFCLRWAKRVRSCRESGEKRCEPRSTRNHQRHRRYQNAFLLVCLFFCSSLGRSCKVWCLSTPHPVSELYLLLCLVLVNS